MADTKISALAAGSAVADTDLFPAVETAGVGPVTKTGAQLRTISGTSKLTLAQGSGAIMQVPASAVGDAVNYSWFQQSSAQSNGPAGRVNYYDDTMSWGWNLGSGGPLTQGDVSKGSICFTMENKFYQGSTFGHEVHLQNKTTAGGSHRPMYFFLPSESDTFGAAIMQQDLDEIVWNNYSGTKAAQINWFLNSGYVQIASGYEFRFLGSNVPCIRQYNAAGNGYNNHPYFDADDRLKASAAVSFIAPTPTTGSYANTFMEIQPLSLAAGGVAIEVDGPAVAGSAYAALMVASCTGDWNFSLFNNSNNVNANATIALRTIGTSAGDPKIRFNVNGGTEWQVGNDNSAGQKFVIGTNDLGVADKLTIDSSGNVAIAGSTGTLITKGYTVATLPTAATSLRGARAHVTDATTPTFLGTLTGGGAVVCPVFCNGTAWVAG